MQIGFELEDSLERRNWTSQAGKLRHRCQTVVAVPHHCPLKPRTLDVAQLGRQGAELGQVAGSKQKSLGAWQVDAATPWRQGASLAARAGLEMFRDSLPCLGVWGPFHRPHQQPLSWGLLVRQNIYVAVVVLE